MVVFHTQCASFMSHLAVRQCQCIPSLIVCNLKLKYLSRQCFLKSIRCWYHKSKIMTRKFGTLHVFIVLLLIYFYSFMHNHF
jgi:hypothetical protein